MRDKKSKIGAIIIAVILASILVSNFLIPNLANAQAADVLLNNVTFQAAQTSAAKCNDFSVSVSKAAHDLKAVWMAQGTLVKNGYGSTVAVAKDVCFIAASTYPTDKGPNEVSVAASGFQDSITRITDPTKSVDNRTINNVGVQQQQSAVIAQQQAAQEKANESSTVGDFVGFIVQGICSALSAFLGVFVGLIGKLMVEVVNLSIGFGNDQPSVVRVGWVIVRDVANMFFILALIVMSLATILRIESYNYKRLLWKLILMALLVNFSLVISTTIISGFDMLIKFFMPTGFKTIFSTLESMVGRGFVNSLEEGQGWGGVVLGISQVIMFLIMIVVFLTLTGLFVVRLIGLYVLLILSPVAYALNILPATQQYAKQWWTTFFKYLIWGPVAMFFIFLSLYLCNTLGLPKSGAASQGDSVWSYVLITGFLFAAVMVAKQAGMAGGNMIINGVQKGAKGLGGAAAGFAGRSYSGYAMKKAQQAEGRGDTKTAAMWKGAAFLNPAVAKKAWQARNKRIEEDIYGPAVGYAHDTLNRIIPTEWRRKKEMVRDEKTGQMVLKKGKFQLGAQTMYGRMGYESVINKKTREINEANLSEEERVDLYMKASHAVDKVAILKSIVANKHEDGLASAMKMGKNNNGDYDFADFNKRILADLQASGMSKEQAGEQMLHVGEMAEGARKTRQYGIAMVDKDGVARAASDFSYIDKLEKAGDTTELKRYLQEDLRLIDKDGAFKDAKGKERGKITDFASFRALLAKTVDENPETGANLENELIGARGAKEASRRYNRAPAEEIIKAWEPATVAIQKGDGTGFENYSSFGRRVVPQMNPGISTGIQNVRQVQGRALTLGGVSMNEDGTFDPKHMTTAEGEKQLQLAVQTAHLSPNMAAGFLTKAKIADKETGEAIARMINEKLEADYPDTEQILDYNHGKQEFVVVHKGQSGGSTSSSEAAEDLAAHMDEQRKRSSAPATFEPPPTPPPPPGPRSTPPPAPSTSPSSPSTTSAPIHEQAASEIIRENPSMTPAQHTVVRDVYRDVHEGKLDISGAEAKLKELGDAAGKAADRLKDSIGSLADLKLKSAGLGVFGAAAANPVMLEKLRQAVRSGIMEGLNKGAKLGSPEMATHMTETLKREAPDAKNADEIVKEFNKT